MAVPGPEGLWEYAKTLPERLREQFLSGMGAFAETRQPAHLAGALNPLSPLMQDAAVQAGGLLAPQVNALSQSLSQGSENLGHGPLSIPDVTGEQLAPLLMLGMGGPNKMGFYSPSGKALTTAPGKGQSGQYLAHLKKEPGAIREAKETGLLQALEQAPGTLTKEEVVSMWNPIELDETVRQEFPPGTEAKQLELKGKQEEFAAHTAEMSRMSYEDRTTPGGLGEPIRARQQNLQIQINNLKHDLGLTPFSDIAPKWADKPDLNLPGGSNPKEILVQLPYPRLANFDSYEAYNEAVRAQDQKGGLYERGHWSEPNVLAHIRTNERDVGGVKALHIEEIQSDWHQAGQKKGYNVPPKITKGRPEDIGQLKIEEFAESVYISTPINGNASRQLASIDNGVLKLNVAPGQTEIIGEFRNNQEALEAFKNTDVYWYDATFPNVGETKVISLSPPPGQYSVSETEDGLWEIYDSGGELVEVEHTREAAEDVARQFGEGVLTAAPGAGTVPDAPYKKDWHELAFKRALMEGINDPSIERLTWTTGDVQKERYNLAKYINSIEAQAVGDNFNLAVTHKDGHAQNLQNVTPDELADHVGKEMAEKIVSQKGGMYSGLDLEVGGEYHKQLYDGKITKFAQKFLKKYGVKPEKWQAPSHTTSSATAKDGTLYYIGGRADGDDIWHIFKEMPDNSEGNWFDDVLMETPGNMDAAREALRKYGDLDDSPYDIWYIDITPEMRQDLQQKGVPLTMNDKKPLLAYA